MTNDWYAAALAEAKAFLDQFADAEEAYVHRESEIVAALCGLLSGAAVIHTAAKYAEASVNTLALLEAEL